MDHWGRPGAERHHIGEKLEKRKRSRRCTDEHLVLIWDGFLLPCAYRFPGQRTAPGKSQNFRQQPREATPAAHEDQHSEVSQEACRSGCHARSTGPSPNLTSKVRGGVGLSQRLSLPELSGAPEMFPIYTVVLP